MNYLQFLEISCTKTQLACTINADIYQSVRSVSEKLMYLVYQYL
jgi:hypothetical protein